jgi:AraC-like DNA-binding protein
MALLMGAARDGGDGTKMVDPELFISTDFVEPKLRNDFWRKVKQPLYELEFHELEPLRQFRGSMRVRTVGDLLVGQVTVGLQRCVRSERTIVQGGIDGYLLQIIRAGGIRGHYGNRHVCAGPGDILLVDLARSSMSENDPGERISLTIPRHLLESSLGQRNLHGLVLQAGLPVTRMLVDYVRGFIGAARELSNPQLPPLQDAMLGLIAAGLTGLDTLPVDVSVRLQTVLRHRVLTFIDTHLSQPDLGPDLIMKRFRVSRAHLYRAFECQGGVTHTIRNKRLDAALLAITRDTNKVHPNVEQIATSNGFRSHDQFRRAFHARFGITPGEVRRSDSVTFNHVAADALVKHLSRIVETYAMIRDQPPVPPICGARFRSRAGIGLRES